MPILLIFAPVIGAILGGAIVVLIFQWDRKRRMKLFRIHAPAFIARAFKRRDYTKFNNP